MQVETLGATQRPVFSSLEGPLISVPEKRVITIINTSQKVIAHLISQIQHTISLDPDAGVDVQSTRVRRRADAGNAYLDTGQGQ